MMPANATQTPIVPPGTTTTTTTTIGSSCSTPQQCNHHHHHHHQQQQQDLMNQYLGHQDNTTTTTTISKEGQEGSLVFAATCLASGFNQEGANHVAGNDLVRACECYKAALEVLIGVEMSLQLQAHQQEMIMAAAAASAGNHHHHHVTTVLSEEMQQSNALNQRLRDILRTNLDLPATSNSNATTAASSSSKDMKNGTFFIYEQPFLFCPEMNAAGEQQQQQQHLQLVTTNQVKLYKARTICNLAMAVHQAGNCVHEASVHYALSLYDLCLECSMGCHGVMTSNIDCLMLSIASLNNKAHIFHEFCEPNSLQIVLDTLYLALTFLPQRVQAVESASIQGILFNVYMLRDLPCARAA